MSGGHGHGTKASARIQKREDTVIRGEEAPSVAGMKKSSDMAKICVLLIPRLGQSVRNNMSWLCYTVIVNSRNI